MRTCTSVRTSNVPVSNQPRRLHHNVLYLNLSDPYTDNFKGYGVEKDTNTMYRTCNSEYGYYAPNAYTIPTRFFPLSQRFSNDVVRFGMYRNFSLNTHMDRTFYWDSGAFNPKQSSCFYICIYKKSALRMMYFGPLQIFIPRPRFSIMHEILATKLSLPIFRIFRSYTNKWVNWTVAESTGINRLVTKIKLLMVKKWLFYSKNNWSGFEISVRLVRNTFLSI